MKSYLALAMLLIASLAACDNQAIAPSSSHPATPAPTAQTPAPTAIPVAMAVTVTYLDQTGSHFTGTIALDGSVPQHGRLVLHLLDADGRELGRVCAQAINLAAGRPVVITFDATGPAIVFDTARPAIQPAC